MMASRKGSKFAKKGSPSLRANRGKAPRGSSRITTTNASSSGEESESPVREQAPSDIREHLGRMKVRINAADVGALEEAAAQGWSVEPSIQVRMNAHACSAAARDVAIGEILAREIQPGVKTFDVLDWYGSPRNKKFEVPGLRVTSAPNTPFAGDSARTLSDKRVPLDPDAMFDLVLVQDVYHSGTIPTQAFGPDIARDLCKRSRSGHIYVLFRPFVGEAGADVFLTKRKEQVWRRDADGLIISVPDARSQPYPKHPDINWILKHTTDGIDSTHVNAAGPYLIHRLAISKPGAYIIGETVLKEGSITRINVPLERIVGITGVFSRVMTALLPTMWRESSWLIHTGILAQLGPRFRARIANGQNLDSAMIVVTKHLEEDPVASAIKAAWPWMYDDLIRGTSMAVLYTGRSQFSQLLSTIRGVYHQSELELIKGRSSSSEPLSWRRHSVAAFAVLVAYYFLKRKLRVTGSIAPLVLIRFNRWFTSGSLAAVYEEIFRWYMPRVFAAVCGLEVFGYIKQVGLMSAVPSAVLHSVCHLAQSQMGVAGLAAAMVYHYRWNQRAVINGGAYWKFASAYALGQDVVAKKVIGPIPAGSGIPGYTSTLASAGDIRGTMEIKVDGESVSPDEALELLGTDPRVFNCMYPVLITNGCLRQPANNEKNLLVALLERTHKLAFVGCDPREVRKQTWKALTRAFHNLRMITPGLDRQYTIEECAAKMGSRGRRILDAFHEDAKGTVAHLTKTVNVKANETLSAAKQIRDEEPTMKPRAIINLHAIIHSRMTQLARSLSDKMHEIFNGQVFDVGGIPVQIFYAPGSTQSDLDRIGVAMESGETVVACSGDDSLFALGTLSFGSTRYIEGDLAMCDQSQDELSLGFVAETYRTLGVDEEFIDLFWHCCKADYAAYKGRLVVKGSPGTQMPTGVTVTTPTNTLAVLAMHIKAILERSTDLTSVGGKLGFVVKVQEHEELGSATFLKGWWRRTREGGQPIWVPLPSALLKLGKILRNPREIARDSKGRRVDDATATAIVAGNMANCYGKVDFAYPLLGPFLATLSKAGFEGTLTVDALESWKPAPRGVPFLLDPEEAERAIIARYGITRTEILEVHALLSFVPSVPCYVEHPVFFRLRDVDYA